MIKNDEFGAEEIFLAPETVSSDAVSGEEREPVGAADGDAPLTLENEPEQAVRVGEIAALRGENRKVYRMSDGTEQAVFYAEPIHAFNADTNTYDNVENTLAEEEDGRHIIGGRHAFIARFSREEENDELFSVENGRHRIAVFAGNTGGRKAQNFRVKACRKTAADAGESDEVVFPDVQNGADYAYSVTGSGVKESIIVREPAGIYRYAFALRTENVTAAFDAESRCVNFRDDETGEDVFTIPAPFMTDKNGEISADVFYEVKDAANGSLILNVVADSVWMNAEDRAFPVVIDPQIKVVGQTAMTTYSYAGGRLYSSPLHTVGTTGCGDGSCNAKRMYMCLKMPVLPRNPRIKRAELRFFQASGSAACCGTPKIGLYRVNGAICAGSCTPYHDSDLIDYAVMRVGHCEDGEVIRYTFDVTALADQVSKGETGAWNLVLRMINETAPCADKITLYGSAYGGAYAPQLIVTYASSYGVNTAYRAHTHELGRFGRGSIDLQCGNLMFESEDFAWAGNRMPVTLKHLYNSALGSCRYTADSAIGLPVADFSAMRIGSGFKLNLMQSMVHVDSLPVQWTDEELADESMRYDGYIYTDESGEATYFKMSRESVCCDSNSQCYALYAEENGGAMRYDPEKRTLRQGDDTCLFDASGRLIRITDASDNHTDITYTAGRITAVTDGAGRSFWFAYSSDGSLTSITAPDGTGILYTYSGDKLSTVTYPDGRKAVITYAADKPAGVTLFDAAGGETYRTAYAFTGDRLTGVTEYGFADGEWVQGTSTAYSYSAAARRTVAEVTTPADAGEEADDVVKTVYAFDDDGNVISEYMYSRDTGNTGIRRRGKQRYSTPVPTAARVWSATSDNLLTNHNFDIAERLG